MNAPVNPNKALWEKGDFTRIADTMRESGEALVQRLGISKGLKVLDLGCGDGTTALPQAKLGADVLGIDVARNLVEAGNRRAQEHGLTNLKFQEGDASNLEQVPDKSFDLVVSIFGAMFAPKPFDVAKEMVRVTRTISLATSNGLGANIAPKMLTTRSNDLSGTCSRFDASPS